MAKEIIISLCFVLSISFTITSGQLFGRPPAPSGGGGGGGAVRPGIGGFAAMLSGIRFQNTPCTGESGDSGTCIAKDECVRRIGTIVSTCGNGYYVCCSFKFTCGSTTIHNETHFVNPSYPRGENGTNTCQVTINKKDDICQLRLDFEEFNLTMPDENGRCTTDSFMIRTTVGERLPMLCGENKGQHLYIEMGRESGNPVVLSVVTNGESTTRRWKIKISLIPCTNLLMAPSGCLQYFRSPSAVVESFNYGAVQPGKSRYLSSLRYTSCIRVEENFCAIKWALARQLDSFSWGIPQITQAENLTSVGYGSGKACNGDDFIGIDQASVEGSGPGEDRLCGNKLLEYNQVISRSKPFSLRVRSNGDSVVNALYSQNGFSLMYVQLPCVQ